VHCSLRVLDEIEESSHNHDDIDWLSDEDSDSLTNIQTFSNFRINSLNFTTTQKPEKFPLCTYYKKLISKRKDKQVLQEDADPSSYEDCLFWVCHLDVPGGTPTNVKRRQWRQ